METLGSISHKVGLYFRKFVIFFKGFNKLYLNLYVERFGYSKIRLYFSGYINSFSNDSRKSQSIFVEYVLYGLVLWSANKFGVMFFKVSFLICRCPM